MGQYLPYSGKNSIQEVIAGIHFQSDFAPEDLKRAQNLIHAELKDNFPQLRSIQKMPEIIVSDGHLSQAPAPVVLGGFELFKSKSDGTPSRTIHLVDNLLTIHYFEYHKWQPILESCLKIFDTVLRIINPSSNSILAISLRYVDRYTYDGLISESGANLLFQRNNPYISSQCFEAGPLWHCQSGWFEMFHSDRVLNQLEVISSIIEQVSTVTVDHNTVCQLREPAQPNDIIWQSPSKEFSQISNILKFLHERNVNILNLMLLPEMLNRIGLSHESNIDN